MANLQKDDVFLLIHALGKGEKRNFKLYMQRNSPDGDLKVVQLFDALDKMPEYDEALLLRKNVDIKKSQLANLKAALYRHILNSLRLLKDDSNISLTLHELFDQSRILYSKGLYLQALKLLEKLKLQARQYHQHTYVQQAIFFEKKIEANHITRSIEERADDLVEESNWLHNRLGSVNGLSNLSLQLYSWYIRHGHARNKTDEEAVDFYFKSHLPEDAMHLTGFYQRLYLFESYCWLHYIKQDYLNFFKYSQRWVQLFEEDTEMIKVEGIQYIKGVNNLLNATYLLRNDKRFILLLRDFENFYQQDLVQRDMNLKAQAFTYLYTNHIHYFYMTGKFTEGLAIVNDIERHLREMSLFLDQHKVLVFYYKIACLYFGAGKNEACISYLNLIINQKTDLRYDLQCYARLLHLIAHFELGNDDLLVYLVKSVYRFMSKLENLSMVEAAIIRFLKASFGATPRQMESKFVKLHETLKRYEHKTSEARALAYLDVVSWLESKIEGVAVEEVLRRKYENRINQPHQHDRV